MTALWYLLRGLVLVLLGRCEYCGRAESCVNYRVTRSDGTEVYSVRLCAHCATDLLDPADGWRWTPTGKGWS